MAAGHVWLFCERNSTEAGASGGPSLHHDHNLALKFFCDGDRFVSAESCAPARNFEAVSGKNSFALKFVQSCHGRVLFPMKTFHVQRARQELIKRDVFATSGKTFGFALDSNSTEIGRLNSH